MNWISTMHLGLRVGVLLGLLAGLAGRAAPAISDDYVTREWHMRDGLLSEQLGGIQQDAKGFLWITTLSAQMRFDGTHFEEVPTDPSGPVSARIMVSSPELGILVSSRSRSGLMKWEEGKSQPWHPEIFHDRSITGILAEPGGKLWAAFDDASIVRYAAGEFTPYTAVNGLPKARTRWFASDVQGRMWIASDGSLTRFQDGKFTQLPETFDGSELRVASSSRGGPWILTRDRLLRLEDDRIVEIAKLPELLGSHYVQVVQEDREGALWIGTRSQGLHVYSNGAIEQVPTSHEDIFSLFEDRDGSMWVGTNGGGLNRIRKRSCQLYDKSEGLLDNQTYSVVEHRSGDLWFANRDGGVVRLHDGTLDVLATHPGWPRMSATSIFPLGPDLMGVTTASGNYSFPADGSANATLFPALPASPVIRATFVARNGDVWMSLDPDRVGRWRAGQLEPFGPAQGMDGRQIRGFTEDADGRIWIGAADGKLFRVTDGKFETVSLGGLRPGNIQAIRVEDTGSVLLGTVTGGLVILENGRVHSCTEKHGLPDSNIGQILADRHGFLWFGSKRGIFRLSRKELSDWAAGKITRVSPLNVGPDEGLKDLSCQGIFQPAACVTRDGRLWFTTRRGMVSIDPSVQLAPSTPLPVTIEEVRADDRRLPLVRPMQLPSSVRKLELRFGVLNLSAPDRVQAKYRLDGFDEDWVIASPARVAAYPRLPPGRYRFNVTASGGADGDDIAGDSLWITIEPQWWQTWWFRLGAVVLALVAFAFAVRGWSHRRLREKLGHLERERAVEHERRRIAQNIHDDLGASLTRISLLTQQARHRNAEGSGYYEQIHSTATEITRSMDEIVWAVNPKYDDLESLVGYLGDFAQGFLGVAGIRCRLDMPGQLPQIVLSSQVRHHLFLSCKEALNNVVKHAEADEVTVGIAIQRGQLVVTIKDNGRGHAAGAERKDDLVAVHAGGGSTRPRVRVGSGLPSMRRRMADLSGTCEISSSEQRGTTVTFIVPLDFTPP